MAVSGLFYPVILSFFYMFRSEKCIVQENNVYLKEVEDGQPVGLDCPFYRLSYQERINYRFTWYIKGNKTPILEEPSSRIHQRDNLLWFFPVVYQDSGAYECFARDRNSTSCYKSIVQISVFNKSAGLCFNEKFYDEQEIPFSSTSKIVCYHMDNFREGMANFSIHWYKGCMPVQGERFLFVKEVLIIRNVREEDKGKYQCKGQYTYLGNKYNFSKSILVTVKGKKERKRTEILYPRNNTIEAELGSNVFTWCNVSSYKDTFISISWRVNKTLVDVLFKGRIEEGIQQEFSVDGAQIFIVSLNITKLKNEDYGRLFVCQAGEVAAYIRIRRPRKNLAGLAALVLLILVPIFICILFKIELVLWYRKSCHPFLHKKVSDGKIYDAYVLYPKTDTQDCFALKVLPEVLEKQCGYNLFILGRDDIPGKALVSVVDETIKQSRRLIIILAPGLPSSEEQHIAVYHALIPDGMKVILIEIDKIKDYSNMPESIRYIKQKQGAITWKGDLKKRSAYSANSRFWKRVRYQMPPEQHVFPDVPLVPTPLDAHQTLGT
ncbi:interleukin-1 receptor-like 2 [Varanus komodoensis]|uniref:interleukin-1 receptor-like 2 n=1 Tax=Varanus komodoensis TaxID=61221 RepID=UPI001CF78257|nr:interleukin-1 receptor-like 2 [Varanus komodoensis]